MANLPYIVVNFRASKCKYIQNFDTQAHASMGVGCSGSYDNGVHSIFFGGMLSTTFIPTVFESLTLAPAELRTMGGGLGISARQAQLAKAFN